VSRSTTDRALRSWGLCDAKVATRRSNRLTMPRPPGVSLAMVVVRSALRRIFTTGGATVAALLGRPTVSLRNEAHGYSTSHRPPLARSPRQAWPIRTLGRFLAQTLLDLSHDPHSRKPAGHESRYRDREAERDTPPVR
jgi:hypothetical protein